MARLATAQRPARARRALKRALLPLPAIAAAVTLFIMSTPLQGFTLVDEAVSQHCQAVPVEVPAEEANELDDWFQGKLPFEFHAPRFGDEAPVTLLGGRLSQVGSEGGARRAAYLLYGVGQHKMTVLIFNRRGQDLHELGRRYTVSGRDLSIHDAGAYRVALYQRGPIGYAVTSDLPVQDLLSLMDGAL
ncbi:hypothetical protein KJ940_12280, partial [Myxococcota bacterium]|nr:hypothetical protein [Myxococcota bacterium]